LNTANACDAKNSNQSTNAIIAGLIVFIFELYRCGFSVAMARPLDFAVPHKRGSWFPLLGDAEEVVGRAAAKRNGQWF
jgi:hypothetical protein